MKTAHSIWHIVDDGETLLPYSSAHSHHIKKAILFEISDDMEDGTYPRVRDYVRVANGIEDNGASYWINRLTRKKNKLKIDFMGCTIVREKEYEDEAIVEFTEPIDVVLDYIGGEPVVKKVKKIKGEFTHDWFWIRGGRQDEIANGFEIWFNIEEYLE